MNPHLPKQPAGAILGLILMPTQIDSALSGACENNSSMSRLEDHLRGNVDGDTLKCGSAEV